MDSIDKLAIADKNFRELKSMIENGASLNELFDNSIRLSLGKHLYNKDGKYASDRSLSENYLNEITDMVTGYVNKKYEDILSGKNSQSQKYIILSKCEATLVNILMHDL